MTDPGDLRPVDPPPRHNRWRVLLSGWASSPVAEPGALSVRHSDASDVQANAVASAPESSALPSVQKPPRSAAVARLLASGTVAVGTALALRAFYDGPMLPRSVFGIGALGLLLAAAAVWRRQPKADESRNRPQLREVLFTIGVLWTALWLV